MQFLVVIIVVILCIADCNSQSVGIKNFKKTNSKIVVAPDADQEFLDIMQSLAKEAASRDDKSLNPGPALETVVEKEAEAVVGAVPAVEKAVLAVEEAEVAPAVENAASEPAYPSPPPQAAAAANKPPLPPLLLTPFLLYLEARRILTDAISQIANVAARARLWLQMRQAQLAVPSSLQTGLAACAEAAAWMQHHAARLSADAAKALEAASVACQEAAISALDQGIRLYSRAPWPSLQALEPLAAAMREGHVGEWLQRHLAGPQAYVERLFSFLAGWCSMIGQWLRRVLPEGFGLAQWSAQWQGLVGGWELKGALMVAQLRPLLARAQGAAGTAWSVALLHLRPAAASAFELARTLVLPRLLDAHKAAEAHPVACILTALALVVASLLLPRRGGSRSSLSAALASLGLGYRDAKVLILGLDNAGKTTLLMMLKENRVSIPMRTKAPTRTDLVLGRTRLCTIDVGGHETARAAHPWERFMDKDVGGVVFVVDAAAPARLPQARALLSQVMQNEVLGGKVPVVVLGNKIDLGEALSEGALRAGLGIEQHLEIRGDMAAGAAAAVNKPGTEGAERGRPVKVFMCSFVSKMGYGDGLVWLMDNFK